MTAPERFDDAVVGAGIVGLAHAYHLARRGRRVVVFERGARAEGASIRNFGMIWPIGQPAGDLRDLALRSLGIWHDVLDATSLWHDRTGSLHLAYQDDEAQVLVEFAGQADATGFPCTLLDPGEVAGQSRLVRTEGLRLGLWSPSETCVDPRAVIAGLPAWLASTFGVRFNFGRAVIGFERPRILTSFGEVEADRLWVCAGDELRALYPEALGALGLTRCKLQMMRSGPLGDGLRIGPMLAAGLTLRHYRAFEGCPTLPALRARIAAERPEFDHFGIHVLVAQNGLGELILGDSHEYDPEIEPFDKAEIDRLILDHLKTFLAVPKLRIAGRWHGHYARSSEGAWRLARPAPSVVAVAGLGGAGMTFSFGLAERVVREELEDEGPLDSSRQP